MKINAVWFINALIAIASINCPGYPHQIQFSCDPVRNLICKLENIGGKLWVIRDKFQKLSGMETRNFKDFNFKNSKIQAKSLLRLNNNNSQKRITFKLQKII